jgi:hypothetical protein
MANANRKWANSQWWVIGGGVISRGADQESSIFQYRGLGGNVVAQALLLEPPASHFSVHREAAAVQVDWPECEEARMTGSGIVLGDRSPAFLAPLRRASLGWLEVI